MVSPESIAGLYLFVDYESQSWERRVSIFEFPRMEQEPDDISLLESPCSSCFFLVL